MITEEIKRRLYEMQDTGYRVFQAKLIPTVDPESIIGVRTPELRRYALELCARPDVDEFLIDLPHRFFDENQLHAFILSAMKDYERCMAGVNAFLPYVDNWACCDQMSPKVFSKHKKELLAEIDGWLASGRTYTVRFAVGMLMEHFLDGDFDPALLEKVSAVRSDEYYVNMMIAWYFATALAKQYDAALPYLTDKRLDPWVHNKAIQKSVESRRISPERKERLKRLRMGT